MKGKIALVGGDEFRPGCEVMDQALLDATGEDSPRVLIVPTAAALEGPEQAAFNGVSYFSRLGAAALPLMVVDSESANNEGLLAPIADSDAVYFTGGNPRHLLGVLEGSLLLARTIELLSGGGLVVGSSAGAMVLGRYMLLDGQCPATGLAGNLVVLPHHESEDPEVVSEKLHRDPAYFRAPTTALGIDAKTGVLNTSGGSRVLGQGNVVVYRRGAWERFSEGDTPDILT